MILRAGEQIAIASTGSDPLCRKFKNCKRNLHGLALDGFARELWRSIFLKQAELMIEASMR